MNISLSSSESLSPESSDRLEDITYESNIELESELEMELR